MRTRCVGVVLGMCALSLPCAADSVSLTGDGSWSAGPWSPHAPAAGDAVTVSGKKLEVDANVNGVAVEVGEGAEVTTTGSSVYFGSGSGVGGWVDWHQVGGSFVSEAAVFELSNSGSGSMTMLFEDADVAFSNKVVLGRSTGKAKYEQRGGSLIVNCKGSGNGFFIGTGNGAGSMALSNVAFTAESGLTVCNGTGESELALVDSTVTFKSGLGLGNPDNSKARLLAVNSAVTLGGSFTTGSSGKSRQRSETILSNTTFNAGNKAISLGGGQNSTSRFEVVGGTFTHTGTLTVGSGLGAQALFSLTDYTPSFSGAFSFTTAAGAYGTYRLLRSPCAFPASVNIGNANEVGQTLSLEEGDYRAASNVNVAQKNATESVLCLKDARLDVSGDVNVVPAVSGILNSSTGRVELVRATLDVQRQMIIGQQGIDGVASYVDDTDSKLYVTNTAKDCGVLQIGRYGHATMDLHGQAEILKLYIGNLSNAWGKVTVHPGASLNVTSELKAGFTGCGVAGLAGPTGIVEQLGGTVTLPYGCAFTMGGNNGSFRDTTGIYRIADGTLTAGCVLTIGNFGSGELIVDGGTVRVWDADHDVTIRLAASGTGAGSRGRVELNGGTVECGQIAKTTTRPGYIGFNGGTLRALEDTANFINAAAESMTVAVRAGGAVIDSNGHAVTIAPALVHDPDADAPVKDGGLVKKGEGTLTLTGASTFTGDVIVEEGTLDMSAANFTLGPDAAIGGAGMFKAPAAGLAVDGTMDLDPTTFAGGLTVEGTVTFGANAKICIANPDQLDPNVKYALVKATSLTGDVPDVIGLPEGWKVRLANNALTVSKDKGFVLIYR